MVDRTLMTARLLDISHVTKSFGGQAALSDVSLGVDEGEFIALLGPSGCGKTTLLRTIAGFVAPDAGSIRIAGEDVTQLPPYRRPLNTVFQNYALFPHLSVIENVAYGPRRQGASKSEASARARESLGLVGLTDFAARLPRELSGGQQQRVALARAIVNRPRLLLLDEPLSALDLKLRKRVQLELKHLQQKLGITFLFVTHDQDEAMTMADRIVVMNAGRIEQIGRGEEIYRAPLTRFVADFIGEANLVACRPMADGTLMPAFGGRAIPRGAVPAGMPAVAVLRPEHARLRVEGDSADGECTARGIVQDLIHAGSHVLVNVAVGDIIVSARVTGGLPQGLREGAPVNVAYRIEDLHLIADRAP
jgi:spermidine/putrescine transport system ATP-binding protein